MDRSALGRLLLVGLMAGVAVLPLASCGEETTADGFTEANRDAFVTACTDPSVDDRLVRDVCECAYEQLAATLPYDRFVELEDTLRIDSLAALPDDVAALIADCVVAEADL